MQESILKFVRAWLGLTPEDDSFDQELIPAINSAFFSAYNIGFGEEAFSIQDDTTNWSTLLSEINNSEIIKSYICLKTRVVFDPPQNAFLLASLEKNLEKMEFMIESEFDN